MSNVSVIDRHIDESRMTDNEIIKTLEKLLLDFRKIEYRDSICQLIEDALNLINHQKEQINGLIAGQETFQKHLAEKNAEIERLQKEANKWKDALMGECILTNCPNHQRLEFKAIKEFVKLVVRRFNCNTPRGAYLYNVMKEIEKEMVGTKADTSVSLIDGHIESDFDSKAFWEDTH